MPAKRRPRGTRNSRLSWEKLRNSRLLDVRLCDLGLRIEGTWIEECIQRIYDELAARDIRLRPHCWLSDEWFSPVGVPGIALPFYLAHPRLIRLEKTQMLEAEGGTREECMKILRHEAGHALQSAYLPHRRKKWQQLFGKSSEPYPEYYCPNPSSRQYVQHLDAWYAQSHPVEDFAETFAVWLKPRNQWRRRYNHWPALKKLEYVERLMKEISGKKPKVTTRVKPDSLPRLKKTLREHYAQKRKRFSVSYSNAFDCDLIRLFTNSPNRGRESAAVFLRRNQKEIREIVARWTGEYIFTLDQVLKEMIGRCRELKLRTVATERRLKLDFCILLTVHTMQYLYHHQEWHPL